MGGPYALDMTVFHHALDRMELSEPQYEWMEYALAVIESAALKVFSES